MGKEGIEREESGGKKVITWRSGKEREGERKVKVWGGWKR